MTRNERKRAAKARHVELTNAVREAFAIQERKDADYAKVSEALDELNGRSGIRGSFTGYKKGLREVSKVREHYVPKGTDEENRLRAIYHRNLYHG